MTAERPTRPVNAVVRAVAILRLLGGAERPLTVTEIASELGLVASTAMHILKTLAHEGLVEQVAGAKRYRLGAGTVALAQAVLDRPRLARRLQPHLDVLSREHGVTAIGVEWDGGEELTVTAISRATTDLSVQASLGSRFPALTSATGRCIAAFGEWPEDRLRAGFAALEWENPPDYAAWTAEVRATRRRGFAVDDGNFIAGITVLAVPVLDGAGRMLGAIAALALGRRLTPAGRTRLVDDLKAAARLPSSAA